MGMEEGGGVAEEAGELGALHCGMGEEGGKFGLIHGEDPLGRELKQCRTWKQLGKHFRSGCLTVVGAGSPTGIAAVKASVEIGARWERASVLNGEIG